MAGQDGLLAGLASGLVIIETPYLTETKVLSLGRWGRFRAWIEHLADLADLHYPFSRVRRSESVPSPRVLVMGSRVYCHPEVARRIRAIAAKTGA